jgi:DNA invertase Pin-like site-specific DNA recombinase
MKVHGKFIAYYRVSTFKQANSELGLRAQKSSVRNYIDSKKGELLNEYIEVESAANKDRIRHGSDINLNNLLNRRPILLKAINQAKIMDATLVVKDVTRLTRFCLLFNYLTATGVKFICSDYPNDDTLMLGFRVQFGEEEAKLISKRTIAGLAKSEKKLGLKGSENLLLVNEKRRISILKSKAELSPNNRRAKAMIVQLSKDQKTLQEIANYLNENSFYTSQGRCFYPTTVKRLLS